MYDDIQLSKHFRENWERRVGNVPQPGAVASMVENSVRLQRGRLFKLHDGTFFNTLSWYWHPELGVIISLDPASNTAVSVLTADQARERRGGRYGG